jgi:chromosome partitioning protein
MKIGVSNLKGGVGKTTIAQNLAVCFAHMGYKVCIVDTDTNQNSLAWSGVRDESLPGILVVGATDSKALNKTVDKLDRDHEIVIIDGTPSLSEMTTRIILSSDILLIPILPSGHDFRAMTQFVERYEQAKEFKAEIPAYFILNQFSENLNVHQDMKNMLTQFELGIMETTVNKRVSYVRTGIEGKGVYESNDDKAKEEMVKLTQEVLKLAHQYNFVQDL